MNHDDKESEYNDSPREESFRKLNNNNSSISCTIKNLHNPENTPDQDSFKSKLHDPCSKFYTSDSVYLKDGIPIPESEPLRLSKKNSFKSKKFPVENPAFDNFFRKPVFQSKYNHDDRIVRQTHTKKRHSIKRTSEMRCDLQFHTKFVSNLVNPINTSSCLNRMFFCWANPIFDNGAKKIIDDHELFTLHDEFESLTLAIKFRIFVNRHKEKYPKFADQNPSIVDYAFIFIRRKLLIGQFLYIFSYAAQFSGPLLSKEFMKLLKNGDQSDKDSPYFWCIFIIISLIMILLGRAIMFNHARHYFNQSGTTLCQILRPLVLSKFLRINYVYNEFYTTTK